MGELCDDVRSDSRLETTLHARLCHRAPRRPTVDLSIVEIARRSGYEDPLYCSKVFHRALG
jgi:AraC-like DNA-binding protein